MTDARALADDAVHHLDRLAAAILDDVGDGPAPAAFASIASEVGESVGRVGVPAFRELTGLVAGVAESLIEGTTDWSPSLGGTLMAAVDDLRTLVQRASQFSSEDSEHLHQRAAELAVYARSRPKTAAPTEVPSTVAPATEVPATVASAAEVLATVTPTVEVPSAEAPVSGAMAPEVRTAEMPTPSPMPTPAMPPPRVIPISDLFYADGPHVLSGGIPASAGRQSDLLGAGIDALDLLSMDRLAMPSMSGPMTVVPVETLVYRGRAALERAAAVREQIKASGTTPTAAVLDEMYDLIGLALKD